MNTKLLKFVLIFQGLYYALTGLWAIVSLESFSRLTEHDHHGEPFEMHSIAAMALVSGIFLIYGGLKEELRRAGGFLGLGFAFAVMIPELIYLPQIGNPFLFWVDFAIEAVAGILLAIGLFVKKRKRL